MKINKISMAIIAATAVMAVSPAVFAQTDTNKPAAGARGAGGRGGMLTVETIDKAVTLTEAEKPKVKTALEDYTKAAQEARQADQSERRSKMMAAREDLDKKLKEILTPEQYTKYQAMPRPGRRGGAGGGAGGGAAN
ncbi:MAG TPA: hypothetical protein VHC44_04220 [Verrucomicrobiae bacterium]|nr:hypothetical protein [Verrucomicrobiae bacterium]